MRLIRKSETQCQFHLGRLDRQVLLELLQGYPCLPPGHHRLTRVAPHHAVDEAQQLLEESLEEHRAATRKQLQAWLADPHRFLQTAQGWTLTLTFPELEQLLQVLNDIRVGSWVALGEPEGKITRVDQAEAPHLWSMELAGFLQMRLIEARES